MMMYTNIINSLWDKTTLVLCIESMSSKRISFNMALASYILKTNYKIPMAILLHPWQNNLYLLTCVHQVHCHS